jgi:hypothetical protein
VLSGEFLDAWVEANPQEEGSTFDPTVWLGAGRSFGFNLGVNSRGPSMGDELLGMNIHFQVLLGTEGYHGFDHFRSIAIYGEKHRGGSSLGRDTI